MLRVNDMRELAVLRDPDQAMVTMVVTFGNFFQLNRNKNHNWQSVTTCLKSFGTVLSDLTYFDFDSVSPDQERLMLAYNIETAEVTNRTQAAYCLNNYLLKIKDHYEQRNL